MAYTLRGPLGEEVRRTPGLTLKVTYPIFTEWLVFTQQWDPKSPWADRRVRLAANLAIDRKTLNQAEYLGFGKAASSIIPRDFEFYWVPPRVPARSGAGQAAPGRGRLPQGLRRGRGRDRRGLRAGSRGGHQRAPGHRASAPPAADGAGRVLQGGSGEAVQASGPRGQRQPPGMRRRGSRPSCSRPASARTAATRTSTRSSGTRPPSSTASAARRCCTGSSSSCTSARCSRPSWSRRCSSASDRGWRRRPTIPGHPYLSPYEDLKLR